MNQCCAMSEQPFQRQVREAIDEVLPSVTRGTGSPVRLPKPIEHVCQELRPDARTSVGDRH